MAQSFCQPLLEALGTAFGDHFRHHHGATGTHPPPSQRVAVAETGKQAESLNTGATLPIQLAEYFRPSNGLRRPFSLRLIRLSLRFAMVGFNPKRESRK